MKPAIKGDLQTEIKKCRCQLKIFSTYSIVLSFQWHLLTQHAVLDFVAYT